MTPEEARLRARKGAYSLHARYEGREITAVARAAFLLRFEQQVDPSYALTREERERRALYARKAYMTGLALASVRARGARKTGGLVRVINQPKGSSANGAGLPDGTTEASDPGRSNEGGAADGDGRPLHSA
jgi:hypothetical protein